MDQIRITIAYDHVDIIPNAQRFVACVGKVMRCVHDFFGKLPIQSRKRAPLSDAKEQEQEFMDQLKLDGCPQFEEERKREWHFRWGMGHRFSACTMIGDKPKTVMV